MTNCTSFIEKTKQAILYQLDKIPCTDCPLRQACNLNNVIYDTSLCDILMDNQETEDNINESTITNR